MQFNFDGRTSAIPSAARSQESLCDIELGVRNVLGNKFRIDRVWVKHKLSCTPSGSPVNLTPYPISLDDFVVGYATSILSHCRRKVLALLSKVGIYCDAWLTNESLKNRSPGSPACSTQARLKAATMAGAPQA